MRNVFAAVSILFAAQWPLPFPTTTTTAPGSSTTTTAPVIARLGGSTTTTSPSDPPATTTTTAAAAPDGSPPPPPPPAPTPGAPPSAPPAPPAGGGDGEVPSLDDNGGFPEHLRRLMESVQRTPSSTTRPLLDAMRPLVEEHGLPEDEALAAVFGSFPVRGLATYTHDWWFPRYGPGWRLHEGTDIFAATGTPVVAPLEGTVRLAHNRLGGTSAWVVGDDGSYVYLTHLSGYAAGLTTGARVAAGDVVGYVGNSGNAATTPPHLHIEFHPGGGEPVDPKPILDRLLADAKERARSLVASYASAQPTAVGMVGRTRTFGPEVTRPDRTTLLWLSSMTPAGVLRLAEREAFRAAADVDGGPKLGNGSP